MKKAGYLNLALGKIRRKGNFQPPIANFKLKIESNFDKARKILPKPFPIRRDK